jgi:hypothetical protein
MPSTLGGAADTLPHTLTGYKLLPLPLPATSIAHGLVS